MPICILPLLPFKSTVKLVIQIPCYNEEETLPSVLKDLPRSVEGFDEVSWLVIDDGSTDRTTAIATELGVDRVVKHPSNLGLAKAFMTGLRTAIEEGADVIAEQTGTTSIPDTAFTNLSSPSSKMGQS